MTRPSKLAQRLVDAANDVKPERQSLGLNLEKIHDLHMQIYEGTVDIGPFPDHSMVTRDMRPQGRSAEEIGMALIARRNGKRIRDLPVVRPGEEYRSI